jgi:CDP-4-dehydro-6-deoxyglucose reductase
MVASGTGFAPIKAIAQHALEKKISRPITLYWGVRLKRDLYQLDAAQAWPHVKFIPVLSDEKWDGRTGFVHRAVMEDFPDMADVQVYACGAPIVIESARRDFSAQCKLPLDEFYADSFLTEADKAATA